jgi:hypothetical protein
MIAGIDRRVDVLGFRQLSMRGLEKAKAGFKLVCMALKLRTSRAQRAQ